VSPSTASVKDYTLYARSNVEGVVSVSLNNETAKNYEGVWTTEKSNASAEPFELFAIPGQQLQDGDNVFNLGGEGISVTHEAIDCISFYNDADGFTSNSDPAILLTHCTS
jgi:hypothetical protein